MRKYEMTIRYALIQAAYWMTASFAYANTDVFLSRYGLNPTQIGLELALSSAAAALAQPFVAAALDRSRRITLKQTISFAAALAILLAILACFAHTPLGITLLFGSMAMVTISVQPLVNSVGFACIDGGQWLDFSAARGVGSGAYALIILAFSALAAIHTRYMLLLYILLNVLLILSLFLLRLPVKENVAGMQPPTDTFVLLRKNKKFTLLLLGIVLAMFGHQIINSFMLFIVQARGGGVMERGFAVFIAAALEIPAMLIFSRVARRVRVELLFKLSAVFFTVKAAMLLPGWGMPGVYFSQCLQILAFAIFMPAGAYYVNALLSEGDQVKGQALLTTALTLSAVFASCIGGFLLDHLGISRTLQVGTAVSALGSLTMVLCTENTKSSCKF